MPILAIISILTFLKKGSYFQYHSFYLLTLSKQTSGLRQNPINVTPIQNLAVFQKQKLIFRENARIWTRNVLNHHSAIKVTEKDREAISLSRQVVGETSNFSLDCSAFQTLEAKCDIAVLELEKIYQISVASGVFFQILI